MRLLPAHSPAPEAGANSARKQSSGIAARYSNCSWKEDKELVGEQGWVKLGKQTAPAQSHPALGQCFQQEVDLHDGFSWKNSAW